MEQSDKRPVVRRRLSDEVAKVLATSIREGEYAVGSRLPKEKDLAHHFGVGRSSMREAIRTLQAEGYVQSSHGVGVFVISDKPSIFGMTDKSLTGGYKMEELFEARILIEGETASLAAKRATEEQRRVLEEIVDEAAKPEVTTDEFISLDAKFHGKIAELSGNSLLLHMWESIAPQFQEYSHRVILIPGRRVQAHKDHTEIMRAIIEARPEDAARLAQEHVITVQKELRMA